MKSQRDKILNHLKRKSITPMDALNLYGCFRLAARIKELRELGHTITTTMPDGYARYQLKRAAR
jgi:hypothetical protein